MRVRILNESGSSAVDLSSEIQAEDEEHQFFFENSGANLTLLYADADANGDPVGLLNTVITGAGHLSNLERPAAFNHVFSEFLAALMGN